MQETSQHLIVHINTKKLKEYSYENTVHEKLVITTHSWHYNKKIEEVLVEVLRWSSSFYLERTYKRSVGTIWEECKNIMEHLKRPSLGNWDSCYADIPDDQNSGDESSQTQDIAVLTGPSRSARLAKSQTIPTKIIVSNLNVSRTYYYFFKHLFLSGKAINK